MPLIARESCGGVAAHFRVVALRFEIVSRETVFSRARLLGRRGSRISDRVDYLSRERTVEPSAPFPNTGEECGARRNQPFTRIVPKAAPPVWHPIT